MVLTCNVKQQTYIAQDIASANQEENVPRERVEIELAEHPRAKHHKLQAQKETHKLSNIVNTIQDEQEWDMLTMNMSEMMPKSPNVALVTENVAQRKIVSSVNAITATWRLLIFCFWS